MRSPLMRTCRRNWSDRAIVYNTEWPHEALGTATPLTRYYPSARAMPGHLPEPEYCYCDEVLQVNSNGVVRFRGEALRLSISLQGLSVAARPKGGDDGVFEF